MKVFRGIRYARAERWRPPVLVHDHRPAEGGGFGPIAPQRIPPERLAKYGWVMDEDCLSLNVWTPSVTGSRPVLVWIHGGGQSQGHTAMPLYDGARLAERGDIVVVTVNFRLGALGALFAPDRLGPDSTNLALRDQLAALAWVREHIAEYGGDPGKVTAMGQSSGAVSVATFLAGGCELFDRVIVQSAGLERVRSPEALGAIADQFFAALGDNPAPTVEEILFAQGEIRTGFVPPQAPFHPGIDGDVIAEHPLVTARTRPMRPIPMLAGTTRDEWRIFDSLVLPDDATFTEEFIRERAEALLGSAAPVDRALDLYRQARPRDTAAALVTDFHFAAPTEQFARAHAAHGNPVFRYELAWPSPKPGLDAYHDTCLPLVFGTTDAVPTLAGDGPDARRMSEAVQDRWIEFIRGGEPWDRYEGFGGATMVLGPESGVVHGHRTEQLALWEDRYPAYG